LGTTVNVRTGDSIEGAPLAVPIGGRYFTDYNQWHALKYGQQLVDFNNLLITATVNFNSIPSWNGAPSAFLNPSNNATGSGGGGQPVGTFTNGDFSTLCFWIHTTGKLLVTINNWGSNLPDSQINMFSQNVIPANRDLFIEYFYTSKTKVVTIRLTGAVNETITAGGITMWTTPDYNASFKKFTGPILSQVWASGQGNRWHADCIVKYLYIGQYIPIGQAMRCKANVDAGVPASYEIDRYLGNNTYAAYPDPRVAASWDPNWGSPMTVDCTGFTRKPNLPMNPGY
jgi:hypothetical protein